MGSVFFGSPCICPVTIEILLKYDDDAILYANVCHFVKDSSRCTSLIKQLKIL